MRNSIKVLFGILALLSFASQLVTAQEDWESTGFYALPPEPGQSWKQTFWVKPWEGWGAPTHYQFQIWTWPPHSTNPGSQSFEAPGFSITGYTVDPRDRPWGVWFHEFNGVPDAQMWAEGVNPISSQGEFITLYFSRGTVVTYPNPYTTTWDNDTPSFVLQVQAYEGDILRRNFDMVFVSPRHQNQLGGYGWVMQPFGDPPYLFSRSSVSGAVGEGPSTRAFPSGTGDDVLAQMLGMQGQGYEGLGEWGYGKLPEPGSMVIWALLGLCGAGATVVYRRRRAAA